MKLVAAGMVVGLGTVAEEEEPQVLVQNTGPWTRGVHEGVTDEVAAMGPGDRKVGLGTA